MDTQLSTTMPNVDDGISQRKTDAEEHHLCSLMTAKAQLEKFQRISSSSKITPFIVCDRSVEFLIDLTKLNCGAAKEH